VEMTRFNEDILPMEIKFRYFVLSGVMMGFVEIHRELKCGGCVLLINLLLCYIVEISIVSFVDLDNYFSIHVFHIEVNS
jgi:hypothetical protein